MNQLDTTWFHLIEKTKKAVPNIMSIGSIVSKLEEECSIDPSQVFE